MDEVYGYQNTWNNVVLSETGHGDPHCKYRCPVFVTGNLLHQPGSNCFGTRGKTLDLEAWITVDNRTFKYGACISWISIDLPLPSHCVGATVCLSSVYRLAGSEIFALELVAKMFLLENLKKYDEYRWTKVYCVIMWEWALLVVSSVSGHLEREGLVILSQIRFMYQSKRFLIKSIYSTRHSLLPPRRSWIEWSIEVEFHEFDRFITTWRDTSLWNWRSLRSWYQEWFVLEE